MAMSNFGNSMWFGPGAYVWGKDELGNPIYRDDGGRTFAETPVQARPPSPEPQFEDTRRGKRGVSPPRDPLAPIAGALYDGFMQGVEAPGRALRGEDVSLGDVWATALDWGVLGAAGDAPPGALRAGNWKDDITQFADPAEVKKLFPDETSGYDAYAPQEMWVTADEILPQPRSPYVEDPGQYHLPLNELEVQRLDKLPASPRSQAALDRAIEDDALVNVFDAYMERGMWDRVRPDMMARADELGVADALMARYPDTRVNLVAPHPASTMEDVYHYTTHDDRLPFFDATRHSTHQTHDRLGAHVGTEQAAIDRMGDHTSGTLLRLKANTSNPFTREAALDWMDNRRAQLSPLGTRQTKGFDPEYNLPTMEHWIKTHGADSPWTEDHTNMFLDWAYDATMPPGVGGSSMGHAQFPLRFGQELAEAGYTNLPYRNAVEDPGSISHIMLVNGPNPAAGAPVLRYPDARFDPRFYHLPNLLAGAVPAGLSLGAILAGDQDQPQG